MEESRIWKSGGCRVLSYRPNFAFGYREGRGVEMEEIEHENKKQARIPFFSFFVILTEGDVER